MTKDEIIAMSKQFWLTEVGAETLSRGWDVEITLEDLEKIIHLVAEQERERIAKKIEKLPFGDTSASFAIYVREA